MEARYGRPTTSGRGRGSAASADTRASQGRNGDPAARVHDNGYALGYDAAIGDRLIVGASAGNTSPEVELTALNDHTSSQMQHVGGYGRYARNASRLSVMGGGTPLKRKYRPLRDQWAGLLLGARTLRRWHSVHSRRVRLRVRPRRAINFLEPQGGFQYLRLSIDGFTEGGAGVLNLVAPDRRASSKRSTLGGRAVKTFGRANAEATRLEVRAAWAHEFTPLSSVRMQFLGDTADNAFDLASPARIENSAILGATFFGLAFCLVRSKKILSGDLGRAIKLWTANIGLRADW